MFRSTKLWVFKDDSLLIAFSKSNQCINLSKTLPIGKKNQSNKLLLQNLHC